jgi:uncharacterized protein YndB with AHSA1/START domain
MSDHELVLERVLDAPRAAVWRCWMEPELLKQWFCPLPWKVTEARMDNRAGGAVYFLMEAPNGEKFPNHGVYLEIVPERKIVSTDAFVGDWQPSEKPFMVSIVTMEDAPGGRTKYRAVARHWTAEDREQHEKMGFHEGWGKAADQLEALARTLK